MVLKIILKFLLQVLEPPCSSKTVTRHSVNSKPKKVTSKRVSIASKARQLGVTREHLSRVIHGHRISRRLMERFRLLPDYAA